MHKSIDDLLKLRPKFIRKKNQTTQYEQKAIDKLTQVPLLKQADALIWQSFNGCSQKRPVVVAVHWHEKPCDEDGLTRHVPPLKQIDGFAVQTFEPLTVVLQKIPV